MADQFYYESGYIDEKYFGYVADAQGLLSNYIESGYIELNYFADQSSYAILSCDAEILTGEVVEALGNWNSLFSQSLQASKSVDVNTSMSAEFTQIAIGSRGKDIDLFAFTEAAIAVQVNVIRSNNIDVTSVFSIATDGRLYRDIIATEEFSLFDLSVSSSRSRAFILETQAAFSISSTPSTNRSSNASLSSDFVLDATSLITSAKQGIANTSAEFNSTIDYTRIRFVNSSVSSSSSLSCVISHIEGADIIVDGFASISASPNVISSIISNIVLESSINVNPNYTGNTRSNINSYFYTTLSNYAGTGRPRHLVTGIDYQYPQEYFSNVAKFGNYSLSPTSPTTIITAYTDIARIIPDPNESWALEHWFYKPIGANTTSRDILTFWYNSSPRFFKINQQDTRQVYFNVYKVGASIPTTNTVNTIVTYDWNHIAVAYENGYIALWLNGVREIYIDLTAHITKPWTGSTEDVRLKINLGQNQRLDDLSFHRGTTLGWNPNSTSITIPTSRRENNSQYTQFLYRFEQNGYDDTSSVVSNISNITAVSSVISSISGPVRTSANVTFSSTLTSIINVDRGADLTAFSNASVSATATLIKPLESAIDSSASLSTEANVTKDVVSNQTVNAYQNVYNTRTRDLEIDTESIATQLTAIIRLAGLFADDLTESFLTADPVVIRSAESSASAEFAEYLDAYRVRFNESAISSEFAVDVDGVVRITSESSLTSEASVSTSVDRVRVGVADLASEFAVNASINIVGKVESTLFNNAALTVNAVKITSATSTTASETTLSADSANSLTRDYVVNANIYANLDASVKKTMYGYADLTAFYSELAVVVKQTATDIECNVVSTMSVVAVKITESNITLNSLFTQTTAVKKYMVGAAGLPSQSTLTASGTTSTDTTAYLSSISFELAISYKTGAGAVDCDVVATMSVNGVAIRSGVSTLSAISTQVANINRIISAASSVASITSVSAQSAKAVYGEIHISSAMSFTAAVRELVIDEIVYVIPAEIWTYEIASETRQYNIGQETREYIIS